MSVPVMYKVSEDMMISVARRNDSVPGLYRAVLLPLQIRIRNAILVKVDIAVNPLPAVMSNVQSHE